MRLFVSLLVLSLTLSAATQVNAQTAKEKEKALKAELKRYKDMKPEQIKAMKDNLDKKTEELRKAEAAQKATAEQVKTLINASSSMDSNITALKAENDQLRAQVADANARADAAESMPVGKAGSMSGKSPKGTYYGVQIGAFTGYTMPKPSLSSGVREDREEGMVKYVIGSYSARSQADALKASLAQMGIADAFVVTYKDGKRLPSSK
jgi:cell division protein FtsN